MTPTPDRQLTQPQRGGRTPKEHLARIEFEPFCGLLIINVDEERIGSAITEAEKDTITNWLMLALDDIDKREALAVRLALTTAAKRIEASAKCDCRAEACRHGRTPHRRDCATINAARHAALVREGIK